MPAIELGEAISLVMAMLGMGALRSYEKKKLQLSRSERERELDDVPDYSEGAVLLLKREKAFG